MADNGPDPFAAQGGGRFVDGVGWVDKNSPYYTQGTPSTDPNAPAAAPGNTSPQGGTTSASGATNSATPGAAPAANTSNQGVQDTVRNTYLQQATQNPIPSVTDPQIAAQVDPYRAEVDRQKQQYLDQQAESAGPYATGALRGQERIASENAGSNVGQFAASLVGNELVQRRNEIQQALSGLSGEITTDQAAALQTKLADLNAQIQKLGISTAAGTAANQLDVQKSLGIGNLNLQMLEALLQNQQFGDTLGFNVASEAANLNQNAGNTLLGG